MLGENHAAATGIDNIFACYINKSLQHFYVAGKAQVDYFTQWLSLLDLFGCDAECGAEF